MTDGLLIGAYERDNFGDLLFLDQTRHFLRGIETRATGLVESDMSALGGVKVAAYPPLLKNDEKIPFLWVVGGETGGTTLRDAARMVGLRGDDSARDAVSITGLPNHVSPYLPRPSRYTSSVMAASVINSVGVSGTWSLVGKHRIETLGALREASFLSVRDSASSVALRKMGIDHRFAPDLVHTISNTWIDNIEKRSNIALVQAKARYIETIGPRAFAQILINSAELRPFHIRLFSAGEAAGHDSRELLEDVADAFEAGGGRNRIDVSVSQTPAEKVAEIASAGLWIGTSLHGYIISTAFDVPRVGLMLRKIRQYSDSWSIPAPAGVSLKSLDRAVQGALEVSRTHDGSRLAAELARLAEVNVLGARAHVEEALEYDRSGLNAAVEARLGKVTHAGMSLERQWRRGRRAGARAVDSIRPLLSIRKSR